MLLFGGRGKISDLMGDFAKGINSFKKGLAEDPTAPTTVQQTLPHQPLPVAPAPQVNADRGAAPVRTSAVFGIDGSEFLFTAVVALVVIGPERPAARHAVRRVNGSVRRAPCRAMSAQASTR